MIVPGNIGLPVVSEMPPEALELLAPVWWLDSMKERTEPWSATYFGRGTVKTLARAQLLPKEADTENGASSVILLAEGSVVNTKRSPLSDFPVDLGEPFFDAARIEVITDTSAIHRLFNASLHLGWRCDVPGNQGQRVPLQICKSEFDDGTLQLSLPSFDETVAQWAELQGRCAVFRFPLSVCSRQSQTAFSLPQYVVRIRRRSQLRVRAPQSLTLKLDFAGEVLSTQLLDVSAMGVRLKYDCGLSSPFPGLTFPTAAIHHNGHLAWAGVLQVMFAREGEGIGACLSMACPDTANAWYTLMDSLLHPRNRSGSNCTDAAWETLRRSGYFNLSGKTPPEFEGKRAEFEETNRRLDQRRTLGTIIHCNRDASVTATVSVAKYFSRSWLVHQLAKFGHSEDIGNSLRALQDTYLQAYEICTRDPSNRWTVIYTEGQVGWHTRSHLAFASTRPESVSVHPIRLLELSTRIPPSSELAEGLSVETATAEECELLLETLALRKTVAYREALDLTSEALDAAAIASAFSTVGIRRERRIFVVRKGGEPIAWMIADRCTPTLNVFGLFDAIRLVPSSNITPSAYGLLIDAARRWYAACGKQSFVCVFDESNWDIEGLRDAHDMGAGHMWICASNGVLDFVEHVIEVTSPLAPERRTDSVLLRSVRLPRVQI